MKKLRSLTALLLALLLTFNLSGCRKRIDTEAAPETTKIQQETTITEEAPVEEEESSGAYDSVGEMQMAFDQFIYDEFISQLEGDYLSIHQMLLNPETYGIDISEAEVTLGDTINEEYLAEARAENQRLKEQFETFDYEQLTEAQQETYLVYEYLLGLALDSTSEDFAYMGGAFTPMQGLQNDIASLLMEYDFYTLEDVEAYLDMMRDIPRYVEDTLEFTKVQAEKGYFMPDVSAQATLQYCQKILRSGSDSPLLSSVEYNLENCSLLTEEQKTAYLEEARQIFTDCILPAYQNIYDTISSLMGQGGNQLGLSYLENGKEYYEHLFRVKTASDRSVLETKELLTEYLNGSIDAIAEIAANNRPAYRAYIYQGINTDYQNLGEILDTLESHIFDNFPYIESVDYTVNYLDSRLAVDGIGAYYVVPPLDGDLPQKIKVGPSNLDANSPSTFATLAHEGLPGHLYQTNYVLQNLENPFRQSVSILGYSEGYATYVELIALNYLKDMEFEEDDELAFEDDEVTLEQCYMIFNNCIIALCDIGIHYEGWTVDNMQAFMSQYFEIEDVSGIYNQLLGDPVGFQSYYTGCVEFLELRRMAQEELGAAFNEVQFHTVLLQSGDVPFSVLRSNVEKYIAAAK